MEDAAILSAIFDEEAEELNSDEANDFHEPDSLTKGRRVKSATCKKLDLSKNTMAGEDFERGSDGNPEPMPEPMPEPTGTKPVKAKRAISSNIAKQATKDPVSVDEGSDDDVAQNVERSNSRGRRKRAVSRQKSQSTNTTDCPAGGESSNDVPPEPTGRAKRGRKKGSVQPRKKVKSSTSTDAGADNEGRSNAASSRSKARGGKTKKTVTQDGEESGDDCQDSSALTCGKAKKSVSRKMLGKTEKHRIMQYVGSLNPTGVAVIAIAAVVRSLPDCEAHLKEVCSNIVPSSTAFYVKHLQEMYQTFYNECSTIKDRYLNFQLKWHNHCGLFLLNCNQELTTMGLHPSDPLAEKVVAVRAQWSRICAENSISLKEKKKFVILYSSAVFNHLLWQCHGVLQKEQETAEISEDGKDTYLRFGGAALATMLHLRYDKMRADNLEDQKRRRISEEITILQRINSYTKEHIPDYLKYRDNGHMYFPCPEMLPFLTAVDLTTRENVNESGFKEHGSELLHIVTTSLQEANHIKSLFVELLLAKVPEFDDLSQVPIQSVYCEFVRKLSNTRINEFIDSFKQTTAASKGMATLAGQNLRDSLLSHHINLKTHMKQ